MLSTNYLDTAHPEHRILVCMEEYFGSFIKTRNVIHNTQKLFLFSEWFDNFLAQVYPKHFLLGNKTWTLMTAQYEARNFWFVARCLAAAVLTAEIEPLKQSRNFNTALLAISEWVKNTLSHQSSEFRKAQTRICRTSVHFSDPRGFEVRFNHRFVKQMSKLTALSNG